MLLEADRGGLGRPALGRPTASIARTRYCTSAPAPARRLRWSQRSRTRRRGRGRGRRRRGARVVGERRPCRCPAASSRSRIGGVAVAERPVLLLDHRFPLARRRLASLHLEDRRVQRRRGLGVRRPGRDAEGRRRAPETVNPSGGAAEPRPQEPGRPARAARSAGWPRTRSTASAAAACRRARSAAARPTPRRVVVGRRDAKGMEEALSAQPQLVDRTAEYEPRRGPGRHRRGQKKGAFAAPAAKTRS